MYDSLDDSGIGNSQSRDVQTVPDRSDNQLHTTKMPTLRNTSNNVQLSPQVGCKTSPTGQGQPTKPKYLELCINTGQYSTSLGEIDLSHVKSDGELFIKIRERYREMRPFRLRRIFSKPVDVHFVRVGFPHYFKKSAANNLNLSFVSFVYSGRTKLVSTANLWKCHRRKR